MGNYKRLYRSRTESMLAGVFGGLGDYFNTDPVLLRLAFVALGVLTGVLPGSIAYLIAWLIMPVEKEPVRVHHQPPPETHDAEIAK